MTITVKPGSALYTYDEGDVIWLHDTENKSYNSRWRDGALRVEVRAPIPTKPEHQPWVSFTATETTKTKVGTRDKTINFTITREQFDQIVAHVHRGDK